MRFTIKTKLGLAFGSILILSAAAGGLGYVRISELADNQAMLAKQGWRQGKIGDFENALWATALTEKNMIIESDDGTIAALVTKLASQRADVAKIGAELKTDLNPLDVKLMADADDQLVRMYKLQDESTKFSVLNSSNRSYALWKHDAVPMLASLTPMLNGVLAELERPDATTQQTQAALLFMDARADWLRLTRLVASFPAVPTIAELDDSARKFQELVTTFRTSLAKSAQAVNAGGVRTDDVVKAYENGLALMSRVADLAREGGNIRAQDISSGEGGKAFDQTYKAYDAISDAIGARMAATSKSAAASADLAKTLLLAAVAASLALGLAAATWIALSISRGLGRAVDLANAVAVGDLGQTITTTSHDEIGDLVTALNTMTVNLKANASVADAIAAGDLTVTAKPQSDRDTLGLALAAMVAKLRAIVGETVAAARNVSSGSQELSASAEQLSQGSTEQAASTEEASASMEQMAANVKQNADNAGQTEVIARRSAADAEASGVAVGKAVEAMQTIAGKITVVQEIARQTDLLALNAAVEAARAGEHGRGFAVVASEVRKLAERSAAAAAEIGALSGETVKAAQGAGAMLSKLVPDIRRTAELVEEITAACREQDVGTTQINQAIGQLDKVTQQNAAASEQVSSTSEELSGQAEQLQAAIAFFRTGDDAGPVAVAAEAGHPVARLQRRVTEELKPGRASGAPRPARAARHTGGFALDMAEPGDAADKGFRRAS